MVLCRDFAEKHWCKRGHSATGRCNFIHEVAPPQAPPEAPPQAPLDLSGGRVVFLPLPPLPPGLVFPPLPPLSLSLPPPPLR